MPTTDLEILRGEHKVRRPREYVLEELTSKSTEGRVVDVAHFARRFMVRRSACGGSLANRSSSIGLCDQAQNCE